MRIISTLIIVSFLVACSGGAAEKAKQEEQKIDSISNQLDQELKEIEKEVEEVNEEIDDLLKDI